jgi:glycosyltransferase involved in cell wall biosynthesis
MHIAFSVVKHFHVGGGIERYTREVSTRLARKGHRVEVYSMRHYGPRVTGPEGVRIVYVPCIAGRATEKLTAAAAAAVACAARRAKPDIVHFHSVAAGAFAWLPNARGIPCVLQLHGIEWQRSRWKRFGRGVLKFLERCAIPQADALTGVSQALCDFYARRYAVSMTYIPGGADLKQPVPPKEMLRLGLQPRKYVLFASRLVREKGAHYLIRAFRKLDPDCHLVMAGEAKGEGMYRRELHDLAGGDPRILFPGFVQGRLLDELFSHALVFAQPSESEGLSLALLEAMSYGNICIASDIPENVEALGGAGVLFASRDAEDLAAKMRTVLCSADHERSLGNLARQRVAQHFSWERITDQLEAFYGQLLKNR